MTKDEFLDKYGNEVVFSTCFSVCDLEDFIPDDAVIDEQKVFRALNSIRRGFESGMTLDWDVVAEVAVENSGSFK